MTDTLFIAGLASGFGVALLLLLAAAFRSYWVDNIRDQLFALRNEMFLYAFDGGVLDSVAHRNLRSLMNAVIRYAHEISLYRLIFLACGHGLLHVKPTPPKLYAEWLDSINQLPHAQAEQFRRFHTQMTFLVFKQMMVGSLLGWLAILFTGIYLLPRVIMSVGSKKFSMSRAAERLRDHVPPINLLETEALKASKLA